MTDWEIALWWASANLKPAIETWPAGRRPVRAYDARFGPLSFDATETAGRSARSRRWKARSSRPLDPEHRDRSRRLLRRAIRGVERAEIAATRDVKLVRLHGLGLQRLRLARAELIESGRDRYPWTSTWAQALHDRPAQPDGLIWMADRRRSNAARATSGCSTSVLTQRRVPIAAGARARSWRRSRRRGRSRGSRSRAALASRLLGRTWSGPSSPRSRGSTLGAARLARRPGDVRGPGAPPAPPSGWRGSRRPCRSLVQRA